MVHATPAVRNAHAAITSKLSSYYNVLNESSRIKAREYFSKLEPHLGWMEAIFLQTLSMISGGTMVSKVPANEIGVPDIKDTNYFDLLSEQSQTDRERWNNIGCSALKAGKLMAIDLIAGMATGFGGTAKGAVEAIIDIRYEKERDISYLDIKRGNYLKLQREAGHHLIAAEMVSTETRPFIIKELEDFGRDNNVRVIIIEEGASQEKIETIWAEYKDSWRDTIIVPLAKQPATLYISKDGTEVGEAYQKGHGDFYDVIQSQLEIVMGVMEIEYVFSSNIDNVGALVSPVILGYFIEQNQQKKIECLMEAAEKFEGDKGGAPALIREKLSVLEEAFVPAEWKDKFLGLEYFPYFNTNTFWFYAQALLDRHFSLPLMVTKEIREKDGNMIWEKVESIMGHGLDQMIWKALVINRGQRFNPAKFLSDLWIGRTDWMRWDRGYLRPAMSNGVYIPKPLVQVGGTVFDLVSQLNDRLDGHGANDSMRGLRTMLIGGEGSHFNVVGRLDTSCPVRYEGDILIIYEYKDGIPSGRLIISGSSEGDEVTIKDKVIFVPAGETVTIKNPKDIRRHSLGRKELEQFLQNANRWPDSQKIRVLEKFFPTLAALKVKVGGQLDSLHEKELDILSRVFKVQGGLTYTVEKKSDEQAKGLWPYLKVVGGSKWGIGKQYTSHADGAFVRATDHKATTILNRQIFVNSMADYGKGREFKGKHFIAIPDPENSVIFLVIGEFDESVNGDKEIVFDQKLTSLIRFACDDGHRDSPKLKAQITELFYEITWAKLFELSLPEIYKEKIKPRLLAQETK